MGATIGALLLWSPVLALAVFAAVTFVLAVIVGVNGWRKFLWPTTKEWLFIPSDNNQPREIPTRLNIWLSIAPQKQGDRFELDMQKERVISGVHFDHGYTDCCPKQWTIQFFDSIGGIVVPLSEH